jgi:hypothetical protein
MARGFERGDEAEKLGLLRAATKVSATDLVAVAISDRVAAGAGRGHRRRARHPRKARADADAQRRAVRQRRRSAPRRARAPGQATSRSSTPAALERSLDARQRATPTRT